MYFLFLLIFYMENLPCRICSIKAPCKINLHLKIGKKRQDGYHELESIFLPLDYGDSIRIERLPSGEKNKLSLITASDEISAEISAEIPTKENLVFKAVNIFREYTGFNDALEINLNKCIPTGACLGGGSSDAASTLLALNFLSGNKLENKVLLEMALSLGSDVPFFIIGKPAFISGRGEIIEPIGFPSAKWIVLVKPGFSSSTAAAFRELDHYRSSSFHEYAGKNMEKGDLIRVIQEDPVTWPYYNDFLAMFLNKMEANREKRQMYSTILSLLSRAGASFSGLSGSGSSCFGVFSRQETAENAVNLLSEIEGSFTRLTFFLAENAKPVVEC